LSLTSNFRPGSKEVQQFLIERTRLHEVFIREEAKSERLSLGLGSALFLAACLVIVFAPESRQGVANWVGAAMLIVAAGVVGYKRVWGRSKVLTFSADQQAGSNGTDNAQPGAVANRVRDNSSPEQGDLTTGTGS
jgi:hypothetical protein